MKPVAQSAGFLACSTLLVFAACTFDQQTLQPSAPEVVVTAVLDPGAGVQQVLVERSLTGSVTVNSSVRYDSLDPINTGGGVPISGASVVINGPDGPMTGLEKKYTGKPAGYGAGRYEIAAGLGKSLAIRAGGKYTLTVKTTDGAVVTGSTVVPTAVLNSTNIMVNPFDRENDTLSMSWPDAPLARTYALRMDSPFGAFMLFNDSTHVAIPGTLRNLFADKLQRVFIPGFQQSVTVVAVDTNFYDYYRSRNDPFTGSGLISRLQGGVGVFGAVVTLGARTLVVTQPTTEPSFEGTYDLIVSATTPSRVIDSFQLYVESATGDEASLSGWYTRNRLSTQRDAVAGTRNGTRIQLDYLQNQDVHTAVMRFIGAQSGDSLVGSYVGVPGTVVFRRRH